MLRMLSTHRGSTEANTKSSADSSADSLGRVTPQDISGRHTATADMLLKSR